MHNGFTADKPGIINTKVSHFTLHHGLYIKSSEHIEQKYNTTIKQHNKKKWQYILLFLGGLSNTKE